MLIDDDGGDSRHFVFIITVVRSCYLRATSTIKLINSYKTVLESMVYRSAVAHCNFFSQLTINKGDDGYTSGCEDLLNTLPYFSLGTFISSEYSYGFRKQLRILISIPNFTLSMRFNLLIFLPTLIALIVESSTSQTNLREHPFCRKLQKLQLQ